MGVYRVEIAVDLSSSAFFLSAGVQWLIPSKLADAFSEFRMTKVEWWYLPYVTSIPSDQASSPFAIAVGWPTELPVKASAFRDISGMRGSCTGNVLNPVSGVLPRNPHTEFQRAGEVFLVIHGAAASIGSTTRPITGQLVMDVTLHLANPLS